MSHPQGERHLHWEFTAYNNADKLPDEKIRWLVTVTVVGYEREEDAEIGARSFVIRDTFFLRRVWECSSCGFQGEMAQAMKALVSKS